MKIFTIALVFILGATCSAASPTSVPCNDNSLPVAVEDPNSDLPTLKEDVAATTAATPSFVERIGDMRKLLTKVQCSLERAKPIVAEIEKEAKRFESSAKRFGERVISKFGDFMDRLIVGTDGNGGVKSLWSSIIGGGGGGGASILPNSDCAICDVATTTTTNKNIDIEQVSTATPAVTPITEKEIHTEQVSTATPAVTATSEKKFDIEKVTTATPDKNILGDELDIMDNEIPTDGDTPMKLQHV